MWMETRLMCSVFYIKNLHILWTYMVLVSICRKYIMEKYYRLIEKKGKKKNITFEQKNSHPCKVMIQRILKPHCSRDLFLLTKLSETSHFCSKHWTPKLIRDLQLYNTFGGHCYICIYIRLQWYFSGDS